MSGLPGSDGPLALDFRFTTEETCRRADEVVDYLKGPRLWVPQLDYPDFSEWMDRTHAQLKTEEKRAILAISQGNVVGAIVYQRHKKVPQTLEIKNITVRPDQRGRHVASFLLRNAEIEGARDFRTVSTMVDAKASNLPIRYFLTRNGYKASVIEDLYCLGAGPDIVYEKANAGSILL